MAMGVAIVFFPSSIGLADTVRDGQWQLGFLGVAQAQQISQGDGVVVAVVDSGVDASHPDLNGSLLPGTNLVISGDGWTDYGGHGTEMAGFIAAHGRALGVAPRAKILPIVDGERDQTQLAKAPEAFRWAVDHGAKVICYAAGAPLPSQDLEDAVQYVRDHDVVLVAAAGNRPIAGRVSYPAAYDGVIAAAGVDRDGAHAASSVSGPQVVLSAPAVDAVTTGIGGGYVAGTGTSAATALIAGAAALVRAKYPRLSAAEVVHRLTATAIDKGPSGRDDEYGYGIVNLVGALTADVPPPSPSTSARATAVSPNGDRGGGGPLALVLVVAAALLVFGAGIVLLRRRMRWWPSQEGSGDR